MLCYHRGEHEVSLSHVSFIGFVPFRLLRRALCGEGSGSGGGWRENLCSRSSGSPAFGVLGVVQ